MRRLLPDPGEDVLPMAEYAADQRVAPPHRPWVLMNMISSVDGAISVDGRSGGLGGPADKAVFAAIRAIPDVILVGAGTVIAENYGPPRLSDDAVTLRRDRGQSEAPRLAIVTASLRLDPTGRVFSDPHNRPIVITSPDATSERLDAVRQVADIVQPGAPRGDDDPADIDLGAAFALLREQHDTKTVLCEGGPTLNGSVYASGALDELCLSFAPSLAGGDSPRILHGAPSSLHPLRLDRVLEQDGMLFFRYLAEH